MAAGIPPIAVASARTGIAALLLFIFARRAIVRSVVVLTRRQRAGVVFAGTLLAGHFALFFAGLQSTSLVAAVSLLSLEPIAVVLASFVAFRLRPTRLQVLALLVATVGAMTVASAAGSGEHRLAGDAMVLGCVVLYGAYVASARGLRDAMPAVPYAACVYAVASIVLWPLAIPLTASAWPLPEPAIGYVLALACIPTLIGHSLVQVAARRMAPVYVALVSPGETVGSLAIAAFLMHAAPTLVEGTGAGLVLLGAILAVAARRR